jgi:hypothetical protein
VYLLWLRTPSLHHFNLLSCNYSSCLSFTRTPVITVGLIQIIQDHLSSQYSWFKQSPLATWDTLFSYSGD